MPWVVFFMRNSDAAAPDRRFRETMFALSLMRDSLSEWSKTPTSAEFVVPEFMPHLQERCARVLKLLGTDEISDFPADVRLPWLKMAAQIILNTQKAADARHQYLHPLATETRRKMTMLVVEFHLGEAYKDAKKLAAELERFRLLNRKRPPKEGQNAAVLRALQAALKWVGHAEHWCKGAEAKDKQGRRIAWSSGEAYAFSVVGVVLATTRFLEPSQRRDAMAFVGYAAKCDNVKSLQEWNDKLGTTHVDVLRVFDKAMKFLARNARSWQYKFEF